MVGTIILFIKKMYGNKNTNYLDRERFQWSGGDANQLFSFIWPNSFQIADAAGGKASAFARTTKWQMFHCVRSYHDNILSNKQV